MSNHKTVDHFISKHPEWDQAIKHLRELISSTELEETLKWGQPTYTIQNKNVLAIGAFKNHFGIWFFNGALLNDPENHLQNDQKGKTKAMRQLRFHSFEEIDDEVVIDFVHQAIKNQKEGKQVEVDVNRKPDIPLLLDKAFSEDKDLRSNFDELTPGRQREYAKYIADAQQDTTKQRRLEKIIPMIKSGVGLNDKYQK